MLKLLNVTKMVRALLPVNSTMALVSTEEYIYLNNRAFPLPENTACVGIDADMVPIASLIDGVGRISIRTLDEDNTLLTQQHSVYDHVLAHEILVTAKQIGATGFELTVRVPGQDAKGPISVKGHGIRLHAHGYDVVVIVDDEVAYHLGARDEKPELVPYTVGRQQIDAFTLTAGGVLYVADWAEGQILGSNGVVIQLDGVLDLVGEDNVLFALTDEGLIHSYHIDGNPVRAADSVKKLKTAEVAVPYGTIYAHGNVLTHHADNTIWYYLNRL